MTATELKTIALQLNVTFRLAEREDLPKLEWYGEYLHFRRVFQRTYEDQLEGSRMMLLAVANDWPIGQIFIQVATVQDIFTDMRRHGYFYSLRVMDAFRGMGLGTALLREAESILIDHRHDSVSIAAAKDNPGARRLYERMGFKVQSEDAGHWHYVDHEGRTRYVVEPCWILEKKLSRF